MTLLSVLPTNVSISSPDGISAAAEDHTFSIGKQLQTYFPRYDNDFILFICHSRTRRSKFSFQYH